MAAVISQKIGMRDDVLIYDARIIIQRQVIMTHSPRTCRNLRAHDQTGSLQQRPIPTARHDTCVCASLFGAVRRVYNVRASAIASGPRNIRVCQQILRLMVVTGLLASARYVSSEQSQRLP